MCHKGAPCDVLLIYNDPIKDFCFPFTVFTKINTASAMRNMFQYILFHDNINMAKCNMKFLHHKTDIPENTLHCWLFIYRKILERKH